MFQLDSLSNIITRTGSWDLTPYAALSLLEHFRTDLVYRQGSSSPQGTVCNLFPVTDRY
jgi:hypothetical protein